LNSDVEDPSITCEPQLALSEKKETAVTRVENTQSTGIVIPGITSLRKPRKNGIVIPGITSLEKHEKPEM